MIVGIERSDPYGNQILDLGRKVLDGRFLPIGCCPMEQLPRYIAACDVVAIPQGPGLMSMGQLPAKLFDAMAMQKAIVATDVSDIRLVL